MPNLSVETAILLTAALVLTASVSLLFRRYLVLSRSGGSTGTALEASKPIVVEPAPTSTATADVADIFISYASADRLIAGFLNRVLTDEGFKVWWDQGLRAGDHYPEEIEAKLNQAKSVLILWTPDAVQSDWVKKEAKLAVQQRKDVPLNYRCEAIPDDFRAIQYVDISKWNADHTHSTFDTVKAQIKERIAARERHRNSLSHPVSVTDKTGAIAPATIREFASFTDYGLLPMIVIPAGRFQMGADPAERDALPPEMNRHLVEIDKPFAVGKHPVTVGEWAWVMLPQDAGTLPDATKLKPITNVNWFEAQDFIARLNKTTGQRYRLLSESEWEYVCRAGRSGPFGIPELSLRTARYDARGVYGQSKRAPKLKELAPVDVGASAPNDWGVCGMHGNVWEWVGDHWHDTYDGDKPRDARPWIETGAKDVKRLHRVVRGGCYRSLPQHLRSAHRAHRRPRMRSSTVGFRLARELVP